jgi:hypothetical protein
MADLSDKIAPFLDSTGVRLFHRGVSDWLHSSTDFTVDVKAADQFVGSRFLGTIVHTCCGANLTRIPTVLQNVVSSSSRLGLALCDQPALKLAFASRHLERASISTADVFDALLIVARDCPGFSNFAQSASVAFTIFGQQSLAWARAAIEAWKLSPIQLLPDENVSLVAHAILRPCHESVLRYLVSSCMDACNETLWLTIAGRPFMTTAAHLSAMVAKEVAIDEFLQRGLPVNLVDVNGMSLLVAALAFWRRSLPQNCRAADEPRRRPFVGNRSAPPRVRRLCSRVPP